MSAFCPPAPALAVSLSPAHAPSPVSASTASFRKKLPLLRCPCYPLVPRSPAHAPSPISIPLLLRHAIFPTSNLQPFSRSLPPSRSLSAAFSLLRLSVCSKLSREASPPPISSSSPALSRSISDAVFLSLSGIYVCSKLPREASLSFSSKLSVEAFRSTACACSSFLFLLFRASGGNFALSSTGNPQPHHSCLPPPPTRSFSWKIVVG